MKIKPDQLSEAIELELEAYSDEIREGLTAAVKDAAGLCVKLLRQSSPKQTGAYSKGWTKKFGAKTKQPYARVYNRDRPWLTHLLEDGHEKQSGGFVEGTHHIAAAEATVEKKLYADTISMIGKTS